ncbi:MAG: tail fiber domain-containing protein [Terriglobales bacterium]
MKRVQVVMYSALLLLFCSALSQAQQSLASTGSNESNADSQVVKNATGKGTTDYVPLWLSATKLGNSNIFQSSSGIGIGTTSPAATLDVDGTVNAATGYNLGGLHFVQGGAALGDAFVGANVGNSTMTGQINVAVGYYTFLNNTTGAYDSAFGAGALYSNTTGAQNAASGTYALNANTTGSGNTATGFNALVANTTGASNTASGSYAMYANTTGNFNSALGNVALYSNTTGIYNSAVGNNALTYNTTGNYNSAFGSHTLLNVTTGSGNTGLAQYAGYTMDNSNITGSNNSALGYATAFGTGSLSNATAIGAYAVVSSNNALVLGCVAGVNICTTTTSVGIGTSTPTNLLTLGQGQGPAIADSWATYSSRRWKTNIQTLHGALAKVEQLRGVSYDLQANGKHEVGVIAEEVGAVVPELVTWDKNGKDAQSVDYSRLTALLIEATKEQQALIEQQQEQIAQLISQVKTIQASLTPSGRNHSEVRTVKADPATVLQ